MKKVWKCPNFSLIIWRNIDAGHAVMSRLRCKKWSCEYCAEQNKQMWRSHLKKRIGKIGGVWYFVTLTAHEKVRSAEMSLKNIRDNIDRLLKRLRRIYADIDYVRVYEKHKKGAYHAHFVMHGLSDRLTRTAMPNGAIKFRVHLVESEGRSWGIKTWFKRTCREMGMGYMVDVQRIDSITRTVNYICKYLTKAQQDITEKNLRHVQTSRRIGSPVDRSNPAWQVAGHVWSSDVGQRVLYDANLKIEINPSFWRDNYVYPAEN